MDIDEFVDNNKTMIRMFEFDKNAVVNGIKGDALRNNNVFPFTNNKSSLNFTYGDYDYISRNGVIWTVTGTGQTYMQNVTITER